MLIGKCSVTALILCVSQNSSIWAIVPGLPTGDDETDSWVIHQKTGEVDLTEPLREAVMIALPQKRVCRDDCHGLCPQCGIDLNQESCRCEDESVDPRWDGLP